MNSEFISERPPNLASRWGVGLISEGFGQLRLGSQRHLKGKSRRAGPPGQTGGGVSEGEVSNKLLDNLAKAGL